jgi:hypothetical protein
MHICARDENTPVIANVGTLYPKIKVISLGDCDVLTVPIADTIYNPKSIKKKPLLTPL